ncbi:MAG: hypothetical protein GWO08_00905 [Gammaproteobacteria bacterium]|nr:hypothetical protein [Gammaproteobacteria bacterium]NIR92269.1 hypothetical protein [Gammaproteobacteria bacterium]NIT41853.1 hypothetical protein [Gammaproteobacteria bacterium]NIW48125.1 hypothetical protein [Gammaproteobacteria bacterium]
MTTVHRGHVVIDQEGEVKPSFVIASVALVTLYNNAVYILCLKLNIDN